MGRNLWTVDTTYHGQLSDFERELYNTWVSVETYDTYNNKTTVALIKLKSGFEIVGTAGCEDPSKFSEELGHVYAIKDALRKLGEFAAFYRAEEARRPIKAKDENIIPFATQEWVRKQLEDTILAHIRMAHR